MDRFESSSTNRASETSDEIQVIEDGLDATPSLNAWTKSKARGFKKQHTSSRPVIDQQQSEARRPSVAGNPPGHPDHYNQQQPQRQPMNDPRRRIVDRPAQTYAEKKALCHFFSNYGYCAFEQRTG